MKKGIVIIIALLAVLCIFTASAEGVTFKTEYFSMELPEGWEFTNEKQEPDSKDGSIELGSFWSPDNESLAFGVYLVYYEDLKNVSLWSSDANELQDYVEAVKEDLAEFRPEYLDTVMAGKIPFVLFRCTDEDGDFIYADTITNGNAIQFEAGVLDLNDKYCPVTDQHIDMIKTILASFKPAT
jgi:hypothetical protein